MIKTFKQFLAEGSSIELTAEDALSRILEYCDDALHAYVNDRVALYRGLDREGFAYAYKNGQESQTSRKSKTGSNFAMLWVDNQKDWANYPKRSKATFVSTSIDTAENFSASKEHDVYVVFPYNRTKLAVCPGDDFNYTSFHALDKIEPYRDIEYLERVIQFNDRYPERYESFQDIRQACAEFDKKVKEVYHKEGERGLDEILDKMSRGMREEYKNFNYNIYDMYSHYLSPEVNEFKLIKSRQLSTIKNEYVELWFDGPAILVRKKLTDQLLSKFYSTHENI